MVKVFSFARNHGIKSTNFWNTWIGLQINYIMQNWLTSCQQNEIIVTVYWQYTPLFKSNRNLFSSVKWWYLFSMYRFEIFHVAWWGLVHSLWKISWVYVVAARLCEHSNSVRFEKRVAKTLQHGYRHGDIIMLYDIITTYEWFFCHNWHELCSGNK